MTSFSCFAKCDDDEMYNDDDDEDYDPILE